MVRMIKIKLSLQNKISRGIPLYIEQGRLDLETLEVLKVLKQETTSQKQVHKLFQSTYNKLKNNVSL